MVASPHSPETPRVVEVSPGNVRFGYTNWRGETALRRVLPGLLFWSRGSKWHPEPQWLMSCWDNEKSCLRTFAMCMVVGWENDDAEFESRGDPTVLPEYPEGHFVVGEGRVRILYENSRGSRRWRLVTPIALRWSVGHDREAPDPQWVLSAWDHEADRPRVFAMNRLSKWERDFGRGP